eukprot:Platyproteum_vivax@DN4612_c0_g1_i1.p1
MVDVLDAKVWMSSATAFALLCVVTASAISVHQIFMHLKYFNQPQLQLNIVRILLMVPIYSVQAFVSYCHPRVAVVLDTVRTCYEGYILFIFLQLLIQYLGGENLILLHFENQKRIPHPWPFKHYFKPVQANRKFFRLVKKGCFQYVLVKPITAILALLLECFDLYEGGRFQSTKGYAYLAAISSVSVWIALYCLVLFYVATKQRLDSFRPLAKFLCIKAILFFSFWQSLVLAAVVQMGWLGGKHTLASAMTSVRIQDWLVCVEMLGFGIAHTYAFSYLDFVTANSTAKKPVLSNLQKVLNVEDVLKEAQDTLWNNGKKTDVMLKEISSGGRNSFHESDSDEETDHLIQLTTN